MVANLVALVIPLGLDTFAVAAALGMIGVTPARRRHITFLFTVFETAMPLIGLAVGVPLGDAVGAAAEFIAIGILIAVGLYTLLSDEEREERRLADLTKLTGPRTIALGLSISLDELAIGFTLGLLHVPSVLVIALIAIQTVIVTQLGLRLGSRLGERTREGAERLAGAALAGLGIVLLAEKILS